MTTKTISIKEEVYNKLIALKRANESFSDLLERLATLNTNLDYLERLRGSIEIENKQELLSEIRNKREEWR